MLYAWNGPEHNVGGRLPCTITALTIEHITDGFDTVSARGTVAIMDYVENCGGHDNWIAEVVSQRGGNIAWTVRCVHPRPFYREKNGDPAFTAVPAINRDMKLFIADKLTYCLQRRRQDPTLDQIRDRVPVYQGECETYEGPCICYELESSTKHHPFPWAVRTGENYPQHCFKCSCGNAWWCDDPTNSRWVLVKDPLAWDSLTRHNGVSVQPLGYIDGGVYLLPTLREKGLIAIG